MRIYYFTYILLFSMCVVSGDDELGNSTKIDDNQKISTPYGNMITGLEMYENAKNISNAKDAAENVVDKMRETSLKETLKGIKPNDVVSKIRNGVYNYKEGMQGIMRFTQSAANKLSSILEFAEKRVNMWRTTLPTIQSYGKNMSVLANQSREHLKSFKLKDLTDLDRKWDREFNRNITRGVRYNVAFYNYLKDKAENKDRIYDYIADKILNNTQLRNELDNRDVTLQARLALEAEDKNEWNVMPTLALAKLAFLSKTLETITTSSNSESVYENGVTQDQRNYEYIAKKLEQENATLTDQRELQVMIRKEMFKAEEECNEIQNLQANIDALYLRLKMRGLERTNKQKQVVYDQITALSTGGELVEIDE